MFAKIALNHNSLRLSLASLIFKDGEINTQRNLILTLSITCLTAVVGSLYSDIGSIFGFMGGFCSTVISYIIPTYIYFVNKNIKMNSFKGICILSIVFLFIICGGISSVMSILKFVGVLEED